MLTLGENSLNWALEHTMRFGDTDVFPTPFEYLAVQHDWSNLRDYLSSQNVIEWRVRPHRNLLAPKGKYGFRVVTQLDPLDFLLFTAIAKEIAPDIESRRIPTTENIVFSYRYQHDPEGRFFDQDMGYRSFLNASRSILEDDSSITHVATADIADFYSRIYLHRLENALQSASRRSSHISAMMHLLSGWNGTETFGIPVGSAASSLLAEITISDIDEALLANGVRFVRYNDDYRIFASSHSEAYRHLAFLANVLFSNHGLTLQPQKTTVLSSSEFIDRFLTTPHDRELDSLHERFEAIIADLGLENWYEAIEYDDLLPEQQEMVNALNLVELFNEELSDDREPDFAAIKFILRRLGQLGDETIVDDVLDNLERLHPVFPDIIRYLQNLRSISGSERNRIGQRIISLIEDSIISELDYHKLWALELFAQSTLWNNHHRFFQLFNSTSSLPTRRKLILAMGRACQTHWFQSQWPTLFDHPPWTRRALLAAASCMPPDARRHWYRSVESQLDPLELSIIRWARQNPF
jgi:hypothetical protein